MSKNKYFKKLREPLRVLSVAPCNNDAELRGEYAEYRRDRICHLYLLTLPKVINQYIKKYSI